MFSVMKMGRNVFPLWIANVSPTKSGVIIERRDQVLIGCLRADWFIASTFLLAPMKAAPHNRYGMVLVQGNDGSYTIILNGNDTPARQLAAFLHEVTHIYNGDIMTGQDVAEIEARTHRQLLEALDLIKQEGET